MLTAVPGAAWLLTMRCICFSMHSPGGSTLTVMTVDSGFCITVAGGSSAPHSAAKRSCFSLACLMRSSSASRRLMRRCSNPSSRGLLRATLGYSMRACGEVSACDTSISVTNSCAGDGPISMVSNFDNSFAFSASMFVRYSTAASFCCFASGSRMR
uniref:Putative secreted protein n=1 Tax=Anopheles triannulatus TaxID=58253 RepID=A0A2M4B1D1_9DIPT